MVQGSVLDPLLFLLYVDDVVKLFTSGVLCKLYADDLKLYPVIQTSQDVSELQSSLDALVAVGQVATYHIQHQVSSTLPWPN